MQQFPLPCAAARLAACRLHVPAHAPRRGCPVGWAGSAHVPPTCLPPPCQLLRSAWPHACSLLCKARTTRCGTRRTMPPRCCAWPGAARCGRVWGGGWRTAVCPQVAQPLGQRSLLMAGLHGCNGSATHPTPHPSAHPTWGTSRYRCGALCSPARTAPAWWPRPSWMPSRPPGRSASAQPQRQQQQEQTRRQRPQRHRPHLGRTAWRRRGQHARWRRAQRHPPHTPRSGGSWARLIGMLPLLSSQWCCPGPWPTWLLLLKPGSGAPAGHGVRLQGMALASAPGMLLVSIGCCRLHPAFASHPAAPHGTARCPAARPAQAGWDVCRCRPGGLVCHNGGLAVWRQQGCCGA